jgi:putative transposase
LTALSDEARAEAMRRFEIIKSHLHADVPVAEVARSYDIPLRTLQRWIERYRTSGLFGLARRTRNDSGRRRLRSELIEAIERLALGKPRLSAKTIHRKTTKVAEEHGWHVPSYASVHSVIRTLDPALVTLAHEGMAAYRDKFEIIHRHRANKPNAIWQADHTRLDVIVLDANGKPVRPWLTIIIDDYSRAIAGFFLFTGAPSALHTSLALRQAIWRKTDPTWAVCGIPDVLYVDHGCDFTSRHLEQVAADLRIGLTFSTIARPQGRGKVERFFRTLNSELLAELPGYIQKGKPISPPKLTLSDLNAIFGKFIVGNYNVRQHSQTGQSPKEAWVGQGWLPRLPDNLEALDLLLVAVARSRLVRRDGIYFQGLRYMDQALAGFVGESVMIRYDPRDITELRVFHRGRFLCRAISTDHATKSISLKDIQTARSARRSSLRDNITGKRGTTAEFLLPEGLSNNENHRASSADRKRSSLAIYMEDRKT